MNYGILQIGIVVDVFIASKKKKSGQISSFVRFIKVTDQDSLLISLCNVMIGSLSFHANIARFYRESAKHTSVNVHISSQTHAGKSNVEFVRNMSYANVLSGDHDLKSNG